MHFDDCSADGQTEAETFLTGAALLEGLENFLKMFRLDPNAGIAISMRSALRTGILRAHGEKTIPGREFRSVFQDVPKNLLQT